MVVSKEFVLMSESESESGSGLKREVALVLPPTNNSENNNGILEYSRKRFRKSLPNHQSNKNNVKEESLNQTPTSDAVLFTNNALHAPLQAEKELVNNMFSPNPSLGALCQPIEEEYTYNLSADDAKSSLVESPGCKLPRNAAKVTKRFTRSSLISNHLSLPLDTGNSTVDIEAKTIHEIPPRQIVVSLRSSTALDEISGLHESSTKQPLKNFARSTLNRRAEPTLTKCNNQVHNVFTDIAGEHSTLLCDNTLRKCTSSDVDCEMELPPAIANSDVQTHKIGDCKNEYYREVGTETGIPIVRYERSEENYASANKSQRRFTRSSLQCTTQPVIINGTKEGQNALDSKVPEIVDDDNRNLEGTSRGKLLAHFAFTELESKVVGHMMIDNKKDVQDASLVKPRQCTRATSKCMTETQGMVEVSKAHNSLPDTPPRRFTRSALECEEKSGMMHEDSKGQNTSLEVIRPVKTPHKKLEMKMSKKIALTKYPAKISELLETGMLEGLSVTYISQTQKNGGVHGLIKDYGILCSCTLCKGHKVVTPSEFKRHAGGSNRNFACCLYLDNGNTFRHVLNLCKDAPLDMLEATIQMAIKSPSVKSVVCLNCKRPLPVRRSLVICKSCLELKKSETNTTTITHIVSRSKALANPSEFDDSSKVISPRNKSTGGKLTRKDLRLHKLVFEKDGLPDGTELGYYVRGKKLLEGYKKGFGIFCFCCNNEISPSQFEAHAGWATRRKPYLHIYTSNGVSLHELSVSLSKGRELSAKDNDDLCGICADYGDLLLCDGCPRAFHKDCVGQLSIPSGKWYCPYCENVHKDQSCANNANALAAGRVSGVDPIEQISKRCIRIVKTPETEIGGCTLCRIPGFSKSGFGPRTIILCDQCEKEFHVGCLRDHNMVDLKELPKGKWFCGRDCSRINCALQKCVIRGPEELPDSITKLIKMKREEPDSNVDISWRLLNGKLASSESRSLLSKAVAIFHNCFDPIVDAVTGRDLIPCMVYGRNIREQDFGGMFCAVLTVNSSVVSAVLIRIFGLEFAELPLVATSSDYQGQGYFQSLFSCIERLLGYLNVKHIVLPAAEEAETIWTKKFGFKRLSHTQMSKYTKEYQMTIFRETPMLQKRVPKCRIRRMPSERT